MFNDLLQNEFFHSPAVNNSQILTQSLLYPAKGMESFQMGGKDLCYSKRLTKNCSFSNLND